MSSLWLCLFFTYLFTTYAIEKTENGNVFEKKLSANLEGLSTFKQKIFSSVFPENAFKKSENNLPELLKAIKSPGSLIVKKVAHETDKAGLKAQLPNSTDNFFNLLIRPIFGNPTLRRKRQTEATHEHDLNVDENLHINSLLDATDRLFNHTAFIERMLNNVDNNSKKKYDHAYINNRVLEPQPDFTRFYKDNGTKELDVGYSELVKNVFKDSSKSDSKQTNSVLNDFPSLEEIKEQSADPLLTSGLFLIEKVTNIILNSIQKVQENKKISQKVFAVSALTSLVLSIGVSASKAFYTGYMISERICRFITGKDGMVTCNLFNILSDSGKAIKNLFSKILKLSDFSKSLLEFPKVSVNLQK